MSEQPLGPGWWLASDGRYYPPETAPGAVAVDEAPSRVPPAQAGRRPVWTRWWFWLLVAAALLPVVVVVVWVLLSSTRSVTLSPVQTVDYTTQPDGPVYTLGHVSSQVVDGALVLTHMQAGPMYLTIQQLGATDDLAFEATTGMQDAAPGSLPSDVGVLVLNGDVEGYAATCEPDGSAKVWSVGVRESVVLGTQEDAGCTQQSNDLRIEITRAMSGDVVTVTFPDGERAAYLPGSSRAPFTGVGFVSMSQDPSANPPQVLVSTYTISLPE